MLEDIACYDVLLDLAANTCKGDGPVVACFVLFSLLEDCSHIGGLPVFGDGSGVQALLVDDGQEWWNLCCKLFHDPSW